MGNDEVKIEIHIHNHGSSPFVPIREFIPFESLHTLKFITGSMSRRIDSLTRALEMNRAPINPKEKVTMADLSATIADLKAKWDELKTLVDDAETTLVGVPQRIADAVAQAQAAGATPEQLQSLTDLASSIATESSELTTALQSQTPPVVPDNGPEAGSTHADVH